MSTGYKPPMSVPDRIQLSGGGTDYKQAQYRHMTVPEKITLGSTERGQPIVRGGVNEPVAPPINMIPEDHTPQPIQVANPIKSDYVTPQSSTTDIRIDSIEERLQAVEEKLSSTHLSSGPSSFWYALTFSTWVMVPLIVVYLVYYQRHK